jgi:hypothetical protein
MLYRVALVRADVSEEHTASKFPRSVLRLLVTVHVVHSSPILLTLMTEAMRSSESSVLKTVTWRNILEYSILYSHRRGNLKPYTVSLFPQLNIATKVLFTTSI